EENPSNSCYPDASSLSQADEPFANNSPSNSVESNTSKKNISRSNSEIDEVQEFVNNKKLKVTRDTSSSETPRRLSYGFTPNNNNCENENDQAFKKIVTRSLTCIKYEIEVVQKRLDSMATLIEKIHDKIENPSISSLNLHNVISDMEIISIDNNESLDVMEERLTNDKPFRTQMVLELTRLMGDSISETVRRIMQKIFTDKFLSNYSYIGHKEKLKLSNLQSCTIIFDAVHKMKKYHDIPFKDIEKPIKLWMAQASERIKKRNEKNTKDKSV
ncbi:uncharacterized protein LOC115034692, partial [Acyrthosiphon pisum]|uniref:DUF4806 domain-containing protein n=1 Tax=Acyrthosiphon pisum TaxID=7029 RepID=A0A8R2NTW4_ACYPI